MYCFDEVGLQCGRLEWRSPGWLLADSVGTLFLRTISADDTATVLEAVITVPGLDETVMFGLMVCPDSVLTTPVIVELCPFPFGSVLIPISHNPYKAVLLLSLFPTETTA